MPGTVHYLRVPPGRLPDSPFMLSYRPGLLIGRAADHELHPLLVQPLEVLCEGLLAPYEMLDVDQARTAPAFEVRLHRVGALPAARLVAAEHIRRVAHIQVISAMMTANLAAAISVVITSATRFLRYRG